MPMRPLRSLEGPRIQQFRMCLLTGVARVVAKGDKVDGLHNG